MKLPLTIEVIYDTCFHCAQKELLVRSRDRNGTGKSCSMITDNEISVPDVIVLIEKLLNTEDNNDHPK
jgi:hypothetical protein